MINKPIMFCSTDYVLESTPTTNPLMQISNFPISNFINENMWEFGRLKFDIDGKCHIVFDLGRIRDIKAVAIIKHNANVEALWRIRATRNLEDGWEFDSDWVELSPGLNNFGLLDWGEFDWGEFSYDIYLGGFNPVGTYLVPEFVNARYVRIDFDSVQEFLQAAKIWISSGYQPEFSAAYGSGLIFTDETTTKQAQSGVDQTSPRVIKRRAIRVQLDNLTKTPFLYNIFGPIIGGKGTSRNFLVILEPTETEVLPFQVVYGKIEEKSVVGSHSVWNRMSTNFTVKESI